MKWREGDRMGENICKTGLIRNLHPEYIKDPYTSIIKRQIIQVKNGQRIGIDTSPEKIYK